MQSQKIKNLFLRQSYIDSWNDYKKCLENSNSTKWDYIILTASNEEQKNNYSYQIETRLKDGYLPKKTHYAVIPDKDGMRVGSGGATFNVMKYIKDISGNESFENKRILIIHSGGDSKRVPQYSACGKLFSPVPRILPDGRTSTIFDEFMIAMSGVASRIQSGVLVLSGDVLLLFNNLQIDFHNEDAVAISIKQTVDIGKNHGVFLADENNNVLKFLHKNSIESLKNEGAVNSQGNVNLDTGAVLLSCRLVDELYSLIDTDTKFNEFVNEKARISFYADFLYPLARLSTLSNYYNEIPEGDFTPELKACRDKLWQVLEKYNLKLISLSPAQFIHFGTTKELLNTVTTDITSFEFLDWSKQGLVNKDCTSNCAVVNSFIDKTVSVPPTSYIENSIINENTIIGENCIISNMILNGETVEDNTVLHGLKLNDGKYVVRKYSVDTNPKENDFWNTKIFTVADTLEKSLNEDGANKTSLCESFNNADTKFILNWNKELENKIRIHNFLLDIKNHLDFDDCRKNFSKNELTEDIIESLLKIAENESYDVRSRIYFFIAKLSELPSLESNKEDLEKACFDTIKQNVLNGVRNFGINYENLIIKKENVETTLPVRVNWGGGWSDTPPYCNENGGTVLNISIKLNGIEPILVTVRKLKELHIEFESQDVGAYGIINSTADIINCYNPYDRFALHKASLIAFGVIKENDNRDLKDILKCLGGGIYLSTQVMGIPKGSGLGTSSILSAACIKALSDFFEIQITDSEIINRVMYMEQLMSTGGGWQDQVGGLCKGLKLLTSEKGNQQNIAITRINLKENIKSELSERFALIYTGQRRLARNLLRDVIGKYIIGDKNTIDILEKIQRLAILMKFELEKGNIDNFASLLNEHWELSKSLDNGCTNTCIEQIFLSIEDLICGRFIAGAGGGGFLQVILKKGVTKKDLQKRLKAIFQDSGVDVWSTEFIF